MRNARRRSAAHGFAVGRARRGRRLSARPCARNRGRLRPGREDPRRLAAPGSRRGRRPSRRHGHACALDAARRRALPRPRARLVAGDRAEPQGPARLLRSGDDRRALEWSDLVHQRQRGRSGGPVDRPRGRLLWQPAAVALARWVLALAASAVLVACYETAAPDRIHSHGLGGLASDRGEARASRGSGAPWWPACRFSRSSSRSPGSRSARTPTHSQSFLYHVVSLEPWPFYVALAGIATSSARSLSRDEPVSDIVLAIGTIALVVSRRRLRAERRHRAPGSEAASRSRPLPSSSSSSCVGSARRVSAIREWGRRIPSALAVVAVVFVVSMVAVNVGRFAAGRGASMPFGAQWTSAKASCRPSTSSPAGRGSGGLGLDGSSLSLLLRGDPNAAVLVDRYPSLVPFPPQTKRARQLGDEYIWSG